jgi:hypothetical protein
MGNPVWEGTDTGDGEHSHRNKAQFEAFLDDLTPGGQEFLAEDCGRQQRESEHNWLSAGHATQTAHLDFASGDGCKVETGDAEGGRSARERTV